MRRIILHHHIFKNAGSTLDFALKKHLGERFSSLDADNEHGRISKTTLIRFLDNDPNLVAVSSHHFHCRDYQAFAFEMGYGLFNFALIRKPIARLISIYKFYRNKPSTDRLASAAKTLELSDFLSLVIEN
jgi:hypothetical protein